MDSQHTTHVRPDHMKQPPRRALIGWRLLALFYDLWPVAALWFVLGLVFSAIYTAAGHGVRENITPFSAMQWLLWLCCWLATGLYAVVSWRRGGQTLGMRPWRLHVIIVQGHGHGWHAPVLRYLVGTVSLLLGGLGFWWAWFDRERLTWHDRFSGTRLVRRSNAD